MIEKGYELREGQLDMALDVFDSITEKQHLLVEAGVGIGKSYAYLVPLFYYHQVYKKPIIIATSTIALQEQLVGDIEKISELIDYPIDVVLAKGSSHFLCKLRALSLLEEEPNEKIKKGIKKKYRVRNDFEINIEDNIWRKINVREFKYNICINCEHKTKCYYFDLRKRMKESQGIIICNQDLLTVHLKKVAYEQHPILNPVTNILVIDEAHNLEEKVRNSMTSKYKLHQVIQVIEGASKSVKPSVIGNHLNTLSSEIRELYSILNNHVDNILSQENDYSIDTGKFNIDFIQIEMLVESIFKKLDKFYDLVQIFESPWKKENNYFDELSDLYGFFSELANRKRINRNTYWLERNHNNLNNLYICGSPNNIDEIINHFYFFRNNTVILTSATLTNENNDDIDEMYRYYITSVGFPKDDIIAEPKYSPFPYDVNSMVYYCSDLPHPTNHKNRFINESIKIILELLKISDGKALILFTSKTDMQDIYKELLKQDLPYNIIIQDDNSQQKALDNFKSDVNSILLGTGTYWEGINIKGISLSNLIIFKLPFPVPDPIIDYKCRVLGKDNVLVPEMIIKLKQGVGRLIRSAEDRGIVSILDPRLGENSKNQYKQLVYEALPMKNSTYDINLLKEFYKKIYESEE